jgi:hypothetical protein
MSTTVRLVCEVEITVDTWDSASSFENLAKRAVREGVEKLSQWKDEDRLRLIKVNEVKFVTHGIKWDAAKGEQQP